jgi:hypothetical protein
VAIAISSITSGTDTGASATVSVTTSESPTTTKVGDLVVVVYANDFYALSNMGTPSATGTPTMNAIAGATGDGGSNEAHIKAWWYVANTAGAQTVSATETGAHDEEKSITAYVLTGADTTTPVDAAAGNTSTTTITTSQVAPAVSPTTTQRVPDLSGHGWRRRGGGQLHHAVSADRAVRDPRRIHLRCRRHEPAQRVGFDRHVHLHGGEQYGVLVVFDRHQDGDGGERHLPAAARAVP